MVTIIKEKKQHREAGYPAESIPLIKEHFFRNFLLGILIAAFLVLLNPTAFAEEGRNCADIAKEQLESVLEKLNIATGEVLSVQQTPAEGICEIAVRDQRGIHVFYTDHLLHYLVMGPLVETKSMANLTAQSVQKIRDQKRIDLSKISLTEALVMGDKNASKKVIVFTDPD